MEKGSGKRGEEEREWEKGVNKKSVEKSSGKRVEKE